MKQAQHPHLMLWVIVLTGCIILGGCVERTLLLRSEPPGARVVVNGEPAADPAPVTIPFQTYGTFEVVASLENHRRLRINVPVKPPWYEHIPFDFFAENIWPLTLHDDHAVTLRMQPVGVAEEGGIDARERAAQERLMKKPEAF